MERHNKDWTREEHILAFNLYCKIPFGSIHMNNPRIIELARILGRKVGSVSLKLSNFARLDPALQARGIRGMKPGANLLRSPKLWLLKVNGCWPKGSESRLNKWPTWKPRVYRPPELNGRQRFVFV